MSNVNTKVNHCYNYIINDNVKSFKNDEHEVKLAKTVIRDFKLPSEEIEEPEVPM